MEENEYYKMGYAKGYDEGGIYILKLLRADIQENWAGDMWDDYYCVADVLNVIDNLIENIGK